MEAVRELGLVMHQAWAGERSLPDLLATASKYLAHPTLLPSEAKDRLFTLTRSWAADPGNARHLEEAGSKEFWREYWNKHAISGTLYREHWAKLGPPARTEAQTEVRFPCRI